MSLTVAPTQGTIIASSGRRLWNSLCEKTREELKRAGETKTALYTAVKYGLDWRYSNPIYKMITAAFEDLGKQRAQATATNLLRNVFKRLSLDEQREGSIDKVVHNYFRHEVRYIEKAKEVLASLLERGIIKEPSVPVVVMCAENGLLGTLIEHFPSKLYWNPILVIRSCERTSFYAKPRIVANLFNNGLIEKEIVFDLVGKFLWREKNYRPKFTVDKKKMDGALKIAEMIFKYLPSQLPGAVELLFSKNVEPGYFLMPMFIRTCDEMFLCETCKNPMFISGGVNLFEQGDYCSGCKKRHEPFEKVLNKLLMEHEKCKFSVFHLEMALFKRGELFRKLMKLSEIQPSEYSNYLAIQAIKKDDFDSFELITQHKNFDPSINYLGILRAIESILISSSCITTKKQFEEYAKGFRKEVVKLASEKRFEILEKQDFRDLIFLFIREKKGSTMTQETIDWAYKQLVRQYHPDKLRKEKNEKEDDFGTRKKRANIQFQQLGEVKEELLLSFSKPSEVRLLKA